MRRLVCELSILKWLHKCPRDLSIFECLVGSEYVFLWNLDNGSSSSCCISAPSSRPLIPHLAVAWKTDLERLQNLSGCLLFFGSLCLRRPVGRILNQLHLQFEAQLVSLFEEVHHGEEEWGEEGNEDDNKDEEEAYGQLVGGVAGVDVDTYKESLQGVHLEDGPEDAEVGDMDNLQLLAWCAGTVLGPQRVVVDDVRTVGEGELTLLGCKDQQAIDSEIQVVDSALFPLIASCSPVA